MFNFEKHFFFLLPPLLTEIDKFCQNFVTSNDSNSSFEHYAKNYFRYCDFKVRQDEVLFV